MQVWNLVCFFVFFISVRCSIDGGVGCASIMYEGRYTSIVIIIKMMKCAVHTEEAMNVSSRCNINIYVVLFLDTPFLSFPNS